MPKKTRILLVDTDKKWLSCLQEHLQASGFQVQAAASRKEAESLLKPGAFDLAVTEIMLEEKDGGFVLAHHIKKAAPEARVVIASSAAQDSGYCFDKTQDPHGWIKADSILHKALRPEQVEAEIRRLLRPGAAAKA